jgi:hypothetical protein
MSSTSLAWNDVIDVHLAFICATDLTHSAITIEHAFTLSSIAPGVQFV